MSLIDVAFGRFGRDNSLDQTSKLGAIVKKADKNPIELGFLFEFVYAEMRRKNKADPFPNASSRK